MSSYNFDDIEPLPLSPEGITVSTVLYSEEYKLSFGLLRALQAKVEYSERALYLTGEVIQLNAAHYTVWQYRLQIILKLGKDINEELNWVEEIALDNIKNYQIWHYRQLLLTELVEKDPKREFPLIQVMLDDDSKNYHVWSYRKWVVLWSGDWSNELEFVENFIDQDVYNNSAWSHRFFANFAQRGFNFTDEQFKREVDYCIAKIELAPQNVSSWNYLIGVYEKLDKPLSDLKQLTLKYANVIESDDQLQSIPALKLLTRIYETEEPKKAEKGYQLLANKYDKIRSNYWNYLNSLINV